MSQARELGLPQLLCPTHGYCSDPFRALRRSRRRGRREVGENECYISSFLP